jgi:hypothetical protein
MVSLVTPALALADAWASIDGKVDEFRAGQKATSILEEPGGHFSGYLYEAEEMIRRLEARGFTIVSRRQLSHTPEPKNAEDRAVQAKTLSDKQGIPEDDELT